jgi:hypothetical protein
MDEKRAPMPPPIRRGLGPARLIVAISYLSLAAVTYWYFQTHFTVRSLAALNPPSTAASHEAPLVQLHHLVPLEAHIMSKCPDAKDCLRDLVLPAMQKVHDKVNFTLSFIGTYVVIRCSPPARFSLTRGYSTTDNDDGVACKHGPEECTFAPTHCHAYLYYPEES